MIIWIRYGKKILGEKYKKGRFSGSAVQDQEHQLGVVVMIREAKVVLGVEVVAGITVAGHQEVGQIQVAEVQFRVPLVAEAEAMKV